MKKQWNRRLLLLLLILCLFLSSCHFPGSRNDSGKHQETTQKAFEELMDELFQTSFEDDLITLHFTLKDPEAYGIEKPQKAFSQISLNENETAKAELKETKKALTSIRRSHLTAEQKKLYDYLAAYLETQISLSSYPEFTNPLSVYQGISTNLPLTLTEFAFYEEEDVKDYLQVLTEIPDMFSQVLSWEKDRAKTGICMSSFECRDTAAQIDTFLSSSDILLTSFEKRLLQLSGLSDSAKKDYIKNNHHLVTSLVIPAFTSLKEELLLLSESAPEGHGLAHYENGLPYYEALLRSMTLSSHSPKKLIRTMKKRLSYLEDAILEIAVDYPDAFQVYYNEESFTDETPEEMLTRLETDILDYYPEPGPVSYTIAPIPDALENSSTVAYYMIPPYDAAEENRIYYGKNNTNSAALFTTLAHEGYPGHLYQQNYFMKQGLHPIYFVLNDTGYKEGWAFYVETDMTSYCDFGSHDEIYHDALTDLYRYNSEYSYCISSLIDLYVNGLDYSREEIGEFLGNLGLDPESGDSLYEFAVAEPGTYLQYYTGYLELLDIREYAEEKLGYDFDAKEFHKAILDYGPCTYDQLSDHMKGWVKEELR